ncbi:hypothetical protein [Streptomyces kronopolitis]|uniref:hypothetical protein n=1 Tax=Streptomyces kronopolitis TaxID=1612435 RepID=UPI0020BD7DE3|nr:hypothetical protein [Streptomyces kronopolitis]MCL6297918.1 hypothetical protein [Streptomyces kronopolitis]
MTEWTWEVAADAGEVHELLCASDRYQGERFHSPVPRRNPATSASLVHDGLVHLLRDGASAAAMFTLTRTPAFEEPPGVFPAAADPAYLSRLAVRPDLVTAASLAGPLCLRRAIALAGERGADMLRAEANPDIESTVECMALLGFRRCAAPFEETAGPRRIHLYRLLT